MNNRQNYVAPVERRIDLTFTEAERIRLIKFLGGGDAVQRAVNTLTGHSVPQMKQVIDMGLLPGILEILGIDPDLLEREFGKKA